MASARDFTILNANDADLAKFEAALYYLQQGPVGSAIIAKAQSEGVKIVFSDPNNPHSGYSAPEHTIVWNPKEGAVVEDANGNDVGVQSPANGLMHEFAHSIDPKQLDQTLLPNAQYLNESEAMATMYADAVAKETGEVTRNNYRGHDIAVANITAHTSAGASGAQEWAQVGANGTAEHGPAYVAGTVIAPQFGSTDAYKNIWDFSGDYAAFDPGSPAPLPATGGLYDATIGGDTPLPDPVVGTAPGSEPAPQPEPQPEPATPPEVGSNTTPPEGPIGWEPIGSGSDGPIYGSGGGGTGDPLLPIDEGDAITPLELATREMVLSVASVGEGNMSFYPGSPSAQEGRTLILATVAGGYADSGRIPERLIMDHPLLIDGNASVHAGIIGVAAPHDGYVI